MGYSFEKCITITNDFQKLLDISKGKSNKTWFDKSSKFYNRSIKSWLEKNDIEVYLTHNEQKSVIAERFIRTLKKKIYKYLSSISENVYIDKLDDIVNKYNNTYHSAIKVKPVYVKSSTCIDSSKKLIMKIVNLKLVILLEYHNIKTFLQKVTLQIDLKKFLC